MDKKLTVHWWARGWPAAVNFIKSYQNLNKTDKKSWSFRSFHPNFRQRTSHGKKAFETSSALHLCVVRVISRCAWICVKCGILQVQRQVRMENQSFSSFYWRQVFTAFTTDSKCPLTQATVTMAAILETTFRWLCMDGWRISILLNGSMRQSNNFSTIAVAAFT